MRLHIATVPHTQLHRGYDWCALTSNARCFADMMARRGHDVTVYASGSTPVSVDVHEWQVLDDAEQAAAEARPQGEWYNAEAFTLYNERAADAIRQECRPGDVLLVNAGVCHRPLAEAVPIPAVEFTVGYAGTFARHRVFPSHAWRHVVAAAAAGDAASLEASIDDVVIPHYFDVHEHPVGDGPDNAQGDFHVFIGRPTPSKGADIAADACRRNGVRLVTAGGGDGLPGVEHRGVIGPGERSDLLGAASALWCPTRYFEPFGKVAVEALLAGTPVIAPAWGAFPELLADPEDGILCRTPVEWLAAPGQIAADLADPAQRSERAHRARVRFGYDIVAPQYERFLSPLTTLA